MYHSTTTIASVASTSKPVTDTPLTLSTLLLPDAPAVVVAAAVVSGILVDVGPTLVAPAPELAIVVVAALPGCIGVDAPPRISGHKQRTRGPHARVSP
jgi:hypothetical protein